MKIPLYKIHTDDEEQKLVDAVIKRKSYWTTGPENIELEKLVAEKVGSKYCLSFANGTCALHAMMLAHGVGHNDEVIVPSFTFISTANSALFVGAKPVFADIEDKTYSLDPSEVKKKITKKTKAIMPIHYGGCPAAKIHELRELAEEKGLLLIEDAAESFGAKIGNKHVGSIGDSGMFSLCGNKALTSGEGGLVVTNDERVYESLKLLRSHGRKETENYFESAKMMDYVQLGFNYRMPTIIAALALAQVRKFDWIAELRRKAARVFDKLLSPPPVRRPMDGSGLFNIYQMYSILFENGKTRDSAVNSLLKSGVSTKIYFPPVHKTYFYSEVLKYRDILPATEGISGRILTLPIFADMTASEIEYVCDIVSEVISKKA